MAFEDLWITEYSEQRIQYLIISCATYSADNSSLPYQLIRSEQQSEEAKAVQAEQRTSGTIIQLDMTQKDHRVQLQG